MKDNFKHMNFDYSKEAIKRHKEMLREMDRQERLFNKSVSIHELNKRFQKNSIQAAARMIFQVLSCPELTTRRVMWGEFKEFLAKNQISLTYTGLAKIVKMFHSKNRRSKLKVIQGGKR